MADDEDSILNGPLHLTASLTKQWNQEAVIHCREPKKMSMITFTDPNNMPVLIADSLISGLDNESTLETPDHPRGISGVFPEKSGFVPTYLARKTFLINSNLAIAMAGGEVHMRAFREDVQEHFRTHPDCSEAMVNRFLHQYKEDQHGKIVLKNIDALLLTTSRIDKNKHIYHLMTPGIRQPDFVEITSSNLGTVLASGCGADSLRNAIQDIDTYSFHGTGPTENWSNSDEAIARNLCLIARLHKVDELTGKMLLDYWGGGYEVIYRKVGGGLAYLHDYTIFFWTLDLQEDNSEYQPEGFIKYERRDEFSILASDRQGVFNLKSMVDVGMPRRPITIKRPDREYFNSDIHMNIVCTRRGNTITNMYLFCHKYKSGELNPSVIILQDDNRIDIGTSEDFSREMNRFIWDSEKRRRRKPKTS